jgi:glycogen operon protein
MGYRLSGNADLFQGDHRRVQASINFLTAHDGFTLHDLVTYNDKHNEANKEDNRDGANDNQSWNHGVEGETDDANIITLRERQKRNLFSTLFLSQGVPMIVAGDEMGRTQKGNNNTYCHDDELSWVDWKLDERRRDLLDFARRVVRFRHQQPVLQRRKFFRGDYVGDSSQKDVSWLRPDSTEMSAEDWSASFVRSWALRLAGDAITSLDESGERIIGDGLLILFNAHHEPLDFKLPEAGDGPAWMLEFDTESPKKKATEVTGKDYRLTGRSLAVLRQPRKT